MESYSPSHVGFFPPLLSRVILSVGMPILQHLSSSPSLPHSCAGQLWLRPLALVFGTGLELPTEEVPDGVPFSAPDAVKECRGRVLVHCQAGISRSATICLAYLMMKKRVRLEEAFEFVKQRRSIISPNFSFMGQLLQFESQVLATSCAAEAASPSGPLRERGKATPTPTSQFVFSFPVSVGVHAAPSSLPYLHSPITTSPSC